MNEKMPMAMAAAMAVMLGLTYLFHNILAAEWLADGNRLHRTAGPVTFAIIGQYATLAFLMAFIFPQGFQRGNPLKDGLRFGLIIGVLIYMTQTLQLFGEFNISFNKSILHNGWHVLETIAGAIAMAFAYGNNSSRSL